MKWTRQRGVLVHRSKVICQKQEVGAIRLQDISSGHQCELHVRLPVRVLRKGQSVSHLRRLFRGWGRVGILLINTKGAPPRTSHQDESGVYLIVALCSSAFRKVGTFHFPGEEPLEEVVGRYSQERSFLGHCKSRHVSK